MKIKFERLLDAGRTTATFHFSSWNEFYEQIYNTKKYNRNIGCRHYKSQQVHSKLARGMGADKLQDYIKLYLSVQLNG